MEYVYIGKLVNTHGIKGEVRLYSDFEYKELVFNNRLPLYLGKEKVQEKIKSYRKHKIYDMIIFENYNNINDVLKYKGNKVYVKRKDLDVPYLDEEIIDFEVYDKRINKKIGNLTDIRKNKHQKLLIIDFKYIIPMIDEFVKKIDLKNKKIIVKTIRGMIDEN